jgi:Reverse transcriptase (RNA-dependent DNA polymerase)
VPRARSPIESGNQNQSDRVEKELAKLDFGVRFKDDVISDNDLDTDSIAALVLSVSTESNPGELKLIREALSGEKRKFWKPSLQSEVANFMDRGAWIPCNKDEVLAKGFKPVGTKTVFKTKDEHDGSTKYELRIVTKGYNMISGVHFQNSFSPVATDAAIHIVIGIALYSMNQEERKLWNYHTLRAAQRSGNRSTKVTAKMQRNWLLGEGRKDQYMHRLALKRSNPNNAWVMEVFDTVAAFLNADPGTEMYIILPEAVVAFLGILTQEEEADKLLYKLNKTMYVNVDAALRYFLKFKRIMLAWSWIEAMQVGSMCVLL